MIDLDKNLKKCSKFKDTFRLSMSPYHCFFNSTRNRILWSCSIVFVYLHCFRIYASESVLDAIQDEDSHIGVAILNDKSDLVRVEQQEIPKMDSGEDDAVSAVRGLADVFLDSVVSRNAHKIRESDEYDREWNGASVAGLQNKAHNILDEHCPMPSKVEPLNFPVRPISNRDLQKVLVPVRRKENENLEAAIAIENMRKINNSFYDWVISNPGVFARVEIKDFPHGRGIAVSNDTPVGGLILSIPKGLLISVESIENDDFAIKAAIGKEASLKNGWYDELQILCIYLLYHRWLGEESRLSPYINILLSSPIENMVFLWESEKLNEYYPDPTNYIRLLSLDIAESVGILYDSIMPSLLTSNPEIFERKSHQTNQEWMFSRENFLWAFAMLNSRHWNLPLHGNAKDSGNEELNTSAFLAPLADLTNFGPPCTKALINEDTNTFDIVATCDFVVGQEVTLWYSDLCEDEALVNYGFSHSLIKPCLNVIELKEQRDLLEQDLETALDEIESLRELLHSCSLSCEGFDSNADVEQHSPEEMSNLITQAREPRVRGNHGGVRKKPIEL